MNKLNVLITGFEPFGNCTMNPSWLAVQAMPEELDGCRLVKARLPVTFLTAFAELEKAIDAAQPHLVICTGLAVRRDHITLERVAINVADARIADNLGNQPVDRIIDYTAPNAYFSSLPNREIINRLAQSGIDASISDSAGTFVCNQVMFKLLHYISSERPQMMGGFIHVPAIPAMLDPDSGLPGMELEKITEALKLAVQTCVESIAAGRWRGTKISIVPYDQNWAADFAQIRDRLSAGLGDMALRIDHIGSTSVPGLASKDIIDLQISVAAFDDRLLEAMEKLGYTRAANIANDHVPSGMTDSPEQWEKWFFRPPQGQRRTNVHVRIIGRANQRYPLLFRDFLRVHAETAAAYGELKKRLAANIANSSMYPDVKDPAVDLIYFAAEKWAVETGWQC